jgi:hypothetical protein
MKPFQYFACKSDIVLKCGSWFMIYNPFRVADWNSWGNCVPIDPMQILSSATLQLSPNPPDVGVYTNSTTFAVPTPATIPTPEVVGASVLSGGQTLANMPVEIVNLTVSATANPDTIDVVFSSAPDPLSVNGYSFVVKLGGVPIAGVVSLPSSNTARFLATMPLMTGTYTVTVLGTGVNAVTFSGGTVNLDGEPFQLPSGDGIPGGDFIFTINVLASTSTVPGAPAVIGGWNASLFSLSALPFCTALGSDMQQNVADSNQWNFRHGTANLSNAIPPQLSDVIFLRSGLQWLMNVPINLGGLSYPDLQISFRNNAGTTQGSRGTIPVIGFNARSYTGNVNLLLTLRCTGSFIMGLRAIDSRGNYYMYETDWFVTC